MVGEDGIPLRQALIAQRERTRQPKCLAEIEEQLALPPFPEELRYLWRIFNRIRGRVGGGFGLAPISWPDIDAFVRHSQMTLAPWEVEVIEALDDTYMNVFSKAR